MPKNQLFYGDNLDVLRRHISDQSVDPVYLDPPFNSRQDYNVLFAERAAPAPARRSRLGLRENADTWEWNSGLAPRLRRVVKKGRPRLRGHADLSAHKARLSPRADGRE
jgi:hypothetical protein